MFIVPAKKAKVKAISGDVVVLFWRMVVRPLDLGDLIDICVLSINGVISI